MLVKIAHRVAIWLSCCEPWIHPLGDADTVTDMSAARLGRGHGRRADMGSDRVVSYGAYRGSVWHCIRGRRVSFDSQKSHAAVVFGAYESTRPIGSCGVAQQGGFGADGVAYVAAWAAYGLADER